MSDLEQRLRAMAATIDWPATPDLAPSVLAAVTATTPASNADAIGHGPVEPALDDGVPAGRPRRRGRRRRLVLVAAAVVAAVVVAGGAVLAASPDVRADLLHALGLGQVRVVVVRELPPLRRPDIADLGTRVSAQEAALATGRPAPRIGALGPPAAFFASRRPDGAVTALYLPRAGLPDALDGVGALLTTFPGDPLAFVQKLVAGDKAVRRVRVGGAPGLWISTPHGIIVGEPGSSAPLELVPRLSSPTLLWRVGTITYRLEADISLASALRLARSVR